MSNKVIDTRQGHWLLSKMGKRVLRPGGKGLTLKLLAGLYISPDDDVVEFAPGMGYTASKIIAERPKSYTGIELNEEAAARLQRTINDATKKIVIANAEDTPLPDGCADKLIGEAMLTMHVDNRKSMIIREAFRLLRPGGYYGIHELSLMPDSISDDIKAHIQRQLSESIHVNARPLTQQEWKDLLMREGFEIVELYTTPMRLLEAGRVIDDEGFFHSLRIGYNIMRDAAARKRILEMRRVFHRYSREMNAVAIIARKI